VSVPPRRAAELNQALSEAGIFASGLEPGSDLETIFLEITGPGGQVHDRPALGVEPPPGPPIQPGPAIPPVDPPPTEPPPGPPQP
jgi:hypothetical protein